LFRLPPLRPNRGVAEGLSIPFISPMRVRCANRCLRPSACVPREQTRAEHIADWVILASKGGQDPPGPRLPDGFIPVMAGDESCRRLIAVVVVLALALFRALGL